MPMSSLKFKHYGNEIVAYNKSLFSEFPLELFDPEYLMTNLLLLDHELDATNLAGRGRIRIFKHNKYTLVLRHYYRGGFASKFSNDAYIWKGLEKARPFQELQLLLLLQGFNLPAPVPVAAHLNKTSFTYSADIVTQFIPDAQSLCILLTKQSIPTKIWHEIGVVIKKFHNHDCNHADLNAHNILIDTEKRIFLIDFDKSKIDRSFNNWKNKNLARLKRSLLKLKSSERKFNYSEQDFQALLEGYNLN